MGGSGTTRILVVDDEREICDLVRLYLENEEFEVETFLDGGAALARVEDEEGEPFDLAVVDVMLPGCDGFELCRRIRARHRWPVIMLCARDAEVDRITGLTLGADDYVTKPFEVKELIARIHAVMRRREGGEGPPQRSWSTTSSS